MTNKERLVPTRDWLRCPRCASRNILWVKARNGYDCRHCGCFFRASFVKKVTFEESTTRDGIND